MKFTVAKKAIALTGAVAMLGSVAACGSDTASGKPAQDKDVTEITVWAWEPTLTQVAKDFTKKTGIKVDLKNVGTNTKEYTQLDNAIELAPVLRTSLRLSTTPSRSTPSRQPAGHHRQDLRLLRLLHPWPVASVQFAGKVYGLPMDSGPMAFFYNKESSTRPVLTPSRSRPGISTTTPPRRFTLWATTTTSPPTPVTPASSTP